MTDPAPTPPEPDAPPAPADRLLVALQYATDHSEPETPDQVVTRAKAYAMFLAGDWAKVGVVQVEVVDGGQGYSTQPTVKFSEGSAMATATVTNGVVTSVAVKKAGVYTTVPVVTIEGGSGSGAVVVAVLAEPPATS